MNVAASFVYASTFYGDTSATKSSSLNYAIFIQGFIEHFDAISALGESTICFLSPRVRDQTNYITFNAILNKLWHC